MIDSGVTWYRVIVDDVRLSFPRAFCSLVDIALPYCPSSVVRTNRLEIVPNEGFAETTLRGSDFPISVESFLAALSSVRQIVWGRFYFLDRAAAAESIDQGDIESCIKASNLTLCIADNSSCFVFARSESLACKLLLTYASVEVLKSDLPKLMMRPEDF